MYFREPSLAHCICAGGDLNFVYALDTSNTAHWMETTAAKPGSWSDREWSWLDVRGLRNQTEATFWSKQVDALLSGYKGECDPKCIPFTNVTVEESDECTSCILNVTKNPDARQVRDRTNRAFADIVADINIQCTDLETPHNIPGQTSLSTAEVWLFFIQGRIADMIYKDRNVARDSSCVGGCPHFFRSFCKEGRCLPSTCTDLAKCMQRLLMTSI